MRDERHGLKKIHPAYPQLRDGTADQIFVAIQTKKTSGFGNFRKPFIVWNEAMHSTAFFGFYWKKQSIPSFKKNLDIKNIPTCDKFQESKTYFLIL